MRGSRHFRLRLAKKSSCSRRPRRRRLGFQPLEGRRLLAADISVSDGFLNITGSNHNDAVDVYAEGDQIVVSTAEFGPDGMTESATQSFARNALRGICFQGGEGDDVFVNDTNLRTIALGGPGNDVLVGGTSHDVLHGSSGDDFLLGDRDVVLGGGGDNAELNGTAADEEQPAGVTVDEPPTDAPPVVDTEPAADTEPLSDADPTTVVPEKDPGESMPVTESSTDNGPAASVDVGGAVAVELAVDVDVAVDIALPAAVEQTGSTDAPIDMDPTFDEPVAETGPVAEADATADLVPAVPVESVAEVEQDVAGVPHFGVTITSSVTVEADGFEHSGYGPASGTVGVSFGLRPLAPPSTPPQGLPELVWFVNCLPCHAMGADWLPYGSATRPNSNQPLIAPLPPVAPSWPALIAADSGGAPTEEPAVNDAADVTEVATDNAFDDVLVGGEGRDFVFGGPGDDLLFGDHLENDLMELLIRSRLLAARPTA